MVLLSALTYTAQLDVWDTTILASIVTLQTSESLKFWRIVTTLGDPILFVTASLAVALILFVQKRMWDAKFMAIAFASTSVLEMPLKLLIHRPRPLESFPGTTPESLSFPSGHTWFATVLYGGVAIILARDRSMAGAALIWTVAGGAVVLVLASRLSLGVHYPIDVIGGLLAGSLCLALAQWLNYARKP